MDNIWLIAQANENQTVPAITSEPVTESEQVTTTVAAEPNAAARPQQKPAAPFNFIFLGVMLLILYFLLFRGPRKKQQQHKQMVKSLQKNDRVRTIGGILGTVVDIKDDEITLKIDESNNTKIKIAPSAIGTNLSND